MALDRGEVITAADMKGGSPGWASIDPMGGNLVCWKSGPILLFSFAVNNNQSASSSPRYARPNGWSVSSSGGGEISVTDINNKSPARVYIRSSGIGMSFTTTANSNCWFVGGGMMQF